MFTKQVLRSAGLGRLAYAAWYAPRTFLKRVLANGIKDELAAWVGESEMRRASHKLAPVTAQKQKSPPICFLTGRAFIHQTLFCAYSLYRFLNESRTCLIVDDGTLTAREITQIHSILPGARVIGHSESEAVLDQALPIRQFPYLRSTRSSYKHLRKLVDVHVIEPGWKLVLDSDMLFLQQPSLIINWLEAPGCAIHLTDVGNAYGYPIMSLQQLAGQPIREMVNVGVLGLDGAQIDWERLEFWCGSLLQQHGSHYLLEQALSAMIVSSQTALAAPRETYIVDPTREDVIEQVGILHHYTAKSKLWYFRYGWRLLERPRD